MKITHLIQTSDKTMCGLSVPIVRAIRSPLSEVTCIRCLGIVYMNRLKKERNNA